MAVDLGSDREVSERTGNARWWSLVVAGSVAVAGGLAGFDRAYERMDQAERDRDALAAQVVRLGGTPVAGEPGRDGERGPQGEPGRDGKDGVDGRDGTDGQDGTPGVDGTPGPSGSVGPSGAPGARGGAGPKGETGDAGPPGPVGPEGPQGPPGERGEKGDTGEPGQNVMCAEGSEPTEVIIAPYPGTYIVCRKSE
jgi:hypothetical protein